MKAFFLIFCELWRQLAQFDELRNTTPLERCFEGSSLEFFSLGLQVCCIKIEM